jgi:ribosome-associated translation inhibitor RaiA
MQVPLEIVFEGMAPSEAVRARIRREASRLERFHNRITSCRVVIELPNKRHHKGNVFSVRVHLTTPGGGDIMVRRSPSQHQAHQDAYVAIRDAFSAARRQLEDFARKQDGRVKTHEPMAERA